MSESQHMEEVELGKLLAKLPPNRAVILEAAAVLLVNGRSYELKLPEITLWCEHESCQRDSLFEPTSDSSPHISDTELSRKYFVYRCKHCERTEKTYSVLTSPAEADRRWIAVKLGEFPPFGQPIPPTANELLKLERPWFVKGLRSEEQGFGVGAFGYYRRIVERQWKRLLGRIIEVAETTRAEPSLIEHLRQAANEQQFAKSIEMAKAAIPPVLLVGGHNPIALLHSALSEGLHAEDDDHCLELATSIREVLYSLGRRMAEAMNSEKTLNDAIGKLHQRRNRQAPEVGKSQGPPARNSPG